MKKVFALIFMLALFANFTSLNAATKATERRTDKTELVKSISQNTIQFVQSEKSLKEKEILLHREAFCNSKTLNKKNSEFTILETSQTDSLVLDEIDKYTISNTYKIEAKKKRNLNKLLQI